MPDETDESASLGHGIQVNHGGPCQLCQLSSVQKGYTVQVGRRIRPLVLHVKGNGDD